MGPSDKAKQMQRQVEKEMKQRMPHATPTLKQTLRMLEKHMERFLCLCLHRRLLLHMVRNPPKFRSLRYLIQEMILFSLPGHLDLQRLLRSPRAKTAHRQLRLNV